MRPYKRAVNYHKRLLDDLEKYDHYFIQPNHKKDDSTRNTAMNNNPNLLGVSNNNTDSTTGLCTIPIAKPSGSHANTGSSSV